MFVWGCLSLRQYTFVCLFKFWFVIDLEPNSPLLNTNFQSLCMNSFSFNYISILFFDYNLICLHVHRCKVLLLIICLTNTIKLNSCFSSIGCLINLNISLCCCIWHLNFCLLITTNHLLIFRLNLHMNLFMDLCLHLTLY